MKKTLLPLLLLLVFSCKKQPAHRVSEEFVGYWIHHFTTGGSRSFSVDSDSRGFLDVSDSNGKTGGGDQSRKWLIKKNTLYFGWLGIGDERFHIDRYPETDTALIISGYDTIPAGATYMILDGSYYRRFP